MMLQWSNLVMPGQKVKVKLNNELLSAEVVECHFTSKLFATAKADTKVDGSNCTRELQFRDLIL